MQRILRLGVAMFAVACGASGPGRPTVATGADGPPVTVDLAPVQLALALEPGAHTSIAQVRSTAAAQLGNRAIAALESRAYAVRASGRPTGADATLYVSGRSFVPAPRASRANAIAETITLGAVGVVAGAAAFTAAGALDASTRRSADGFALERGLEVAEVVALDAAAAVALDAAAAVALDAAAAVALDAGSAIDPAAGFTAAAAPRPAAPSPKLALRMTLVENRTGRVLWQAQDRFPANAARPRELARAAAALLATLPPAAPGS